MKVKVSATKKDWLKAMEGVSDETPIMDLVIALGIRELKKLAKVRPGRQLGKVSRKRR